jgi:hypothetical protein
MSTPSLGKRLLPLILFGWAIGAIRYLLDFLAPDQAMYMGLYYLMPVALLWIGMTRRWGAVSWRQVAGTMVLLAFCTWFVWNSTAYLTGQFLGWEHGRFAPNRAAPVAETLFGKVWGGVSTGFLTAIAGSVWCLVFGTVFIWLPARFQSKSSAQPG